MYFYIALHNVIDPQIVPQNACNVCRELNITLPAVQGLAGENHQIESKNYIPAKKFKRAKKSVHVI